MDSDDPQPRTPGRRLRREEWNSVLERHIPAVRTFVRMHLDPGLRSKEAVSDLVQSALRELIANGDAVDWQGEEALRTYLWTSVTRKIIDKRRYWSAQRRDSAREHGQESEALQLATYTGTEGAGSPSQVVIRGEELERLQAAFDALDEREKQLFSMRWIFDIPLTRIAAELGVSETGVRGELGRISARIASRM